MRTSGLVLDVYDDVHGDTMRRLYSSLEDVPELMKTAQNLSGEDREKLPDDAFALVLVNGEERLRKYACVDQGNTALSVMYFLENGHKLPPEAQKVAAKNLVTACGWYDIVPPEPLQKVAFMGGMLANAVKSNPVGTALTAIAAPSIVKGTRDSIRSNLSRVHAGEAMGEVAGGLHALSNKVAELSGTSAMPASANPASKPSTRAATVQKTAHLEPVIEVTSRERAWVETEKKASRYAIPSLQRYPLDSYAHVKQAAAYFEEYHMRFEPELAKEYAENLTKRASELNVELPASVRHFGAEPTDIFDVFKLAEDEDFRDLEGNEMITGKDLKHLATVGLHQLKTSFGHDFAEEFHKDPVAIYKSMPREQKKMIRRMATDNAPGSELNA